MRNATYKYIDFTVEAYEEYFKIFFSGEGVLLNSIMDIHCSTARGRGRPKSDGCRCEGRGGQNFSL